MDQHPKPKSWIGFGFGFGQTGDRKAMLTVLGKPKRFQPTINCDV
jgi:hypothetical protein